VAAELRSKVAAATRLTCSVGVAANRMLAKIASDRHKPDGQFVLGSSRDEVMAFMSQLPIRKVCESASAWCARTA
jgi:DNA polymerase kappa